MKSPAVHDKSNLHPVLEGLNEQQLGAVYNDAHIRKCQKGEILFEAGAPADTLFLVMRGSVQVIPAEPSETRIAHVVKKDEAISYKQFSANGKRKVTAIVQEPASVLALNESVCCKFDPDIRARLSGNLENLLAASLDKIFMDRDFAIRNSSKAQAALGKLLLGTQERYSRSNTIKSLLNSIPKLPHYASELAGIVLNDGVSHKEVADLARQDPSLTGAVLKSVNSSYYGLTHKVTDFQHAAILLGFNQLYQTIMGLGIQNTMPNQSQFRRLQNHSIVISVLCFEISQLTSTGRGAVLNTIGLLHDIGKSVLLLLISKNPKLAFFISLLDNACLGAQLLRHWEIPELVCRTLEYQNFPEFVPPEDIPEDIRKHVAILYIAHLCHDYVAGKPESGTSSVFLEYYLAELAIGAVDIPSFVHNTLMPCLAKRQSPLPKTVKKFLGGMAIAQGQGSHSELPNDPSLPEGENRSAA